MPQSLAEQLKSIPISANLGESLERARGFAREQAHRGVMLEHLLLALIEDPDAAGVLQVCNVDLVRLGTDVSGYLGRLLEDMRAENGKEEPRLDPELLRVMHAAGQAAQQSRRRQIDGAIVLAAVVGDGKSPAAGLLKAHGVTFEEAIRALQKASAQARSKQFATPPGAGAVAPIAQPASGAMDNAEPAADSKGKSSNGAAQPQGAAQTVEDILAAARTRIQQRSSAVASQVDSTVSSEPRLAEPETHPPSGRSSFPASPPPAPDTPTGEPPAPQPPPAAATASAPQAQPSWTPAAPPPQSPQSLMARLPQPPPQRTPPPFAQRPLQPGEGPQRPPLPQRAGPGGGPPQPGFPNRPARAPWPDPAEPASPPRPAAANGALADTPAPAARPPGQKTPRPGQRTGGQGPLVESIPRRMRVGVAASAQVRISRDKIDGLIHLLLNGRGMTQRPEALLTRALSVRLRAPNGGFWIEPTSPETQWVATAPGLQQDEFMSWRWNVTPQWRGRGRLLLVVTARTVGRDGVAAETAPPDRVIEVRVRGNRLRSVGRWGGLLAAVLLGAALGRFGNEFWALGAAAFKKIAGG